MFFFPGDFFRVFGLSKMRHEPTAGANLCKWHLAKAWKLTWDGRCIGVHGDVHMIRKDKTLLWVRLKLGRHQISWLIQILTST